MLEFNTMEVFKSIIEVLKDIGIFSVGLWFIQHLINKSSTRKIETYKTELDQKTKEFQTNLDLKSEQFKSELNLKGFKSTRVYEKQLETIVELHEKLVILNILMTELTASFKQVRENYEKEESERVEKFVESYNDFMRFFQTRELYFPQLLVDKIYNIKAEYFSSFRDYKFGSEIRVSDNTTSNRMIREAGENVRENIQPALKDLRDEFRRLIGA